MLLILSTFLVKKKEIFPQTRGAKAFKNDHHHFLACSFLFLNFID